MTVRSLAFGRCKDRWWASPLDATSPRRVEPHRRMLRVHDDGPRHEVLETAPALVEEDRHEPEEARDHGKDEYDETRKRASESGRIVGAIENANAEQPHSRRLARS